MTPAQFGEYVQIAAIAAVVIGCAVLIACRLRGNVRNFSDKEVMR